MVCQLLMYSSVIVGITISRGSLVFSQSRVKGFCQSQQCRLLPVGCWVRKKRVLSPLFLTKKARAISQLMKSH